MRRLGQTMPRSRGRYSPLVFVAGVLAETVAPGARGSGLEHVAHRTLGCGDLGKSSLRNVGV